MSPRNALFHPKEYPSHAANDGRGKKPSNTQLIYSIRRLVTRLFAELPSREWLGWIDYRATKLIQSPFEWVFWKLEQRLGRLEVDIKLNR